MKEICLYLYIEKEEKKKYVSSQEGKRGISKPVLFGWPSPPVTVVVHGGSDLLETSNVATGNEGGEDTLGRGDVLLGGVETVVEAVLHDGLELVVDLLLGPAEAGGVLGHLETGDGDTTGVGGLTGGVPDGIGTLVSLTVSLEDVDGLLGGTHVGTLGDELGTSGDQGLGLLARDLVLGGTGEGDVDLADVDPGAGTLEVLELGLEGVSGGQLGELLAVNLDLGDLGDLLGSEASLTRGDQSALGVRQGEDGTAELDDLEGSVLGDVARARDGDTLALEGLLAARDVLDHVLDVVDQTVTGGLGTDERTTPAATLTGEDTLPLVADLLVLAEHVTDLTAGDTDITGGHVSVGTDVLAQLGHEGDTEAADLVVGLALGVEVGTTLTTTHAEAGQGILEDLLETEELEDGQVDCKSGGVSRESGSAEL